MPKTDKDKFLPKDIRNAIIRHIVKQDMIVAGDDFEDTISHLLTEGCPGLNNMSDRDIVAELFRAFPVD